MTDAELSAKLKAALTSAPGKPNRITQAQAVDMIGRVGWFIFTEHLADGRYVMDEAVLERLVYIFDPGYHRAISEQEMKDLHEKQIFIDMGYDE